MLSIIVCSRSVKPNDLLLDNIQETVGCQYEVVWIDNSLNKYSIFEAYNFGAKKSLFTNLCFMHEDICIKTLNWGRIVTEILCKNEVGVLGVAGALVKTRSPSPWWIANGYKADDYLSYNIIQNRRDKWCHEYSNPLSSNLSEVVVVDGVWLCCRKNVWNQAKFDDINYNGFHFYDLDFCMQVKALGLKNFVTLNVLLQHSSTGNLSEEWLKAAETFHKKWHSYLPVIVHDKFKRSLNELEYQALVSYLWILIKFQYGTMLMKIMIWFKQTFYKMPNKQSFKQLYNILKYTKRDY